MRATIGVLATTGHHNCAHCCTPGNVFGNPPTARKWEGLHGGVQSLPVDVGKEIQRRIIQTRAPPIFKCQKRAVFMKDGLVS